MKDLYWYLTVILHIASIYTGEFQTVIDPFVLQSPPTKNVISIRKQNCPPGLLFLLQIWSILNFDKLGHYFHWSFCLSWRTIQYPSKKIPFALNLNISRDCSFTTKPSNQFHSCAFFYFLKIIVPWSYLVRKLENCHLHLYYLRCICSLTIISLFIPIG